MGHTHLSFVVEITTQPPNPSLFCHRCRIGNCRRRRFLPSWICWLWWSLPGWTCWSPIRSWLCWCLWCLRIRRGCRCPSLCCPSICRPSCSCPSRCCPSCCPSSSHLCRPSSTCSSRSTHCRKDRRTRRTMGIQNQILNIFIFVLLDLQNVTIL